MGGMLDLVKKLGFSPKENAESVFGKSYSNHKGYCIEVDFAQQTIHYPEPIRAESKTTQNFSQPENFVVLECVDRLLTKGYKPENIILEKTWKLGHQGKGRLDILVTKDDGSAYLMVECKTWGREFEKEFHNIQKDGGQLFSYFQQDKNTEILMLYASVLEGNAIKKRNEIIKIEDEYRSAGTVADFYEKWNKLTKNNGVWENTPYNFIPKALTMDALEEITQKDSGFIFNRFLEILRHNVVSDKPNAFNKIFTLFLCKIYDEKDKEGTDEELAFQWIEGQDNYVSFQLRLTDLYKKGMKTFLEKKVTDFSDEDFENQYASLFAGKDELKQQFKENVLHKLRLEKNNEFAIKEVYDEKSFKENAKVVKEVVELLQGYKIRYTKKQQYLSDFFELLLTTGLKQESGQFFTPVPVAQFIIRSLPIDKIVTEKLLMGRKDDLLPYIIDYAAGSGHFLTESMHEMQRLLADADRGKLKSESQSFIDVSKIRHFDWAEKYVYGIEKDYRLVKVGKVGCYLHGDGLANVIHSDGLANFKHGDYKEKLKETDKDFPQENKQFDIVVSNPPYSVSAFKNVARDYYTEKDFELYNNLTDNSSEIECLFVERTAQLLKDGGVAGIILPSSILSNSGIYAKAREIILQHFKIIAITELGSNTFMATGTNTVVLFLERRSNYDSIKLKQWVKTFFTNWQDRDSNPPKPFNVIEKPLEKYARHVWGVSFDDYATLLKKEANKTIDGFFKREQEKLYYFLLAYGQKVVLVKTGEKDAEKRFLGYEFSNRRGSEGIHPLQRGKSIDECTRLFDENSFDNPKKASTYIYRAFNGDADSEIDESMKNNVSRVDLVDMLAFDRSYFEKTINLNSKKKQKIESKWEIVSLGEVIELISGQSPESDFYNQEQKGIPFFQGKTEFGEIYLNTPVCWTTKITKESTKGDVLMTVRAPVGPVNLNPFDKICIGRGLNALKVSEKISNVYLFYYLKFNQNLIIGNEGAVFPSISREQILSIKIPLPPLDVQEKIVAEIEAVEQSEKIILSELNTLKDKITDVALQSGGTEYKVGDVITLEYGSALPEWDRVKGDFPVMGSNGITGYHNAYLIEGPSIIVGRKGSAGKVTWVEENNYPIDTTFYVNVIDERNSIKLLYYILQKLNLEKSSGGLGVPGLNRNDVYNLSVIIPPLPEQQKIVAEIEALEQRIAEAQKQLDAIPAQKEGVLKKYL